MTQKNTLAIIAVLAAVLSVGTFSIILNSVKVQAQEGQTFSASLSGKDEVPPTESNSTGTAKFQVDENSSQVSYWVNVTGIKKINQAHIHNGTEGQNGDIVVTLTKNKSAKGNDGPPNIGFSGNITKDDLQGPLKDKELTDLVSLMSDGNAYVNVHTDKYPDGAIRGQISSGEASTVGMSTEGSTMTSENASAPMMEQDSNLTQSSNTTS
ncbi:MAG: CHRD domain-containing protein [Nitrososphaeraceae archaeon]